MNIVVAFAVTAGVFAAMFSYLPDKHVPWRYCWVPGIVTAGLFTLGKYVLGLYLGKSAVASSFGAAGSLAVVLVWVYYSAQIVLFGAELSYVIAHGREEDEKARDPQTASGPASTVPVRAPAMRSRAA